MLMSKQGTWHLHECPGVLHSLLFGFINRDNLRDMCPVQIVPDMVLGFYNADLDGVGAHVVIPEEQLSQARRINLGDAREVQNNVLGTYLGDCLYL